MIEITQAKLHELFSYDAQTGDFAWRIKKGRNVKVGQPLNGTNGHGYKAVKIDGKSYLVHRLIWLYVYGNLPKLDIDHKNKIRNYNRL